MLYWLCLALIVNVQVMKRLTAAGSHLSFVAQPAPLIIEMKRRLKTMKYFKDYLIEWISFPLDSCSQVYAEV